MVPGANRRLPPGLTEVHSVKPVLIPDYSRSTQMRDYSLTSACNHKGGKKSLSLSVQNATPFIPKGRHVTWKSPLSSGVLIGS